jgi:hypothetical protein
MAIGRRDVTDKVGKPVRGGEVTLHADNATLATGLESRQAP